MPAEASNQVSALRHAGTGYDVTYSYTYDGNGNILSVSDGTNTTTYEYDSANQLLRENNQAGGFTKTWTYDNAGNILTRTEYAYTTGSLENATPTDTVTYTYGNSAWGDLLTGYDGNTITSDQLGNMLSDGTWNYTWEHGRELASMTDGETTWEYSYNADGMRTYRTNGSTGYSYVYNGSELDCMYIRRGNDETRVNFTHAPDGTPMGFVVGTTTYYYVTNLQGDVVALLSPSGNKVVEYTYDAWGNILSITGSKADTIGKWNPLRYRGYVYDDETGLYYLQSRYYNPKLGRFINADGYIATGQNVFSNNAFAYCGNNPVIYADYTGLAAVLLLDRDLPGHIGVVAQDDYGEWWHFYWGTTTVWDRFLCAFGVPVRPTTWCVKYSGQVSLNAINESSQYSGDYEECTFIEGDFSASVNEFQNPTGKYNLYSNNCSQVSLRVLSKSDNTSSNALLGASKRLLPQMAFMEYKIRTLIENGNIATYIGRLLEKLIS